MSTLGVLLRKDLRAVRNIGRVLRRHSRFKLVFIMGFAGVMLGGLFILFLDGFRFLDSFGGAGFMITRRLFSLFFLGLGVMLLLSSIVSAYSTTFRSRDLPFLLTNPFPVRALVTYKFFESSLLSSWAFVFIILPFAAAYGVHERLGVQFAVWTLLFAAPFLLLWSALGTILSLSLVRWVPRGRTLFVLLLIACGAAAYWLQVPRSAGDPFGSPSFMLSRIVPGLRMASAPLLPSWWTAEGIMACTRGEFGRGAMLWCVLASNTLLAVLAVQWVGECTFYEGYQRATGARGTARRRAILLPGLDRACGVPLRDVRALVVKDVRTFFRDPLQWSQALVFFGLLTLYFGSLRSFRYDRLDDLWRNLIAFLNVFSVSAVQCSLASRFVYPQLSLEGQAFWVIGLSPTTPGRVLVTKFVTAVVCMLSVGLALMLLSTRMLGVDPAVRNVTLALTAAVSIAVCGLSAGLGAVFIDLKQSNPMAIVSGFGGTVNLALSLGFMLATIVPFGLVFHLAALGHLSLAGRAAAARFAWAWLVACTLATGLVPLAAGWRSLMRRDF